MEVLVGFMEKKCRLGLMLYAVVIGAAGMAQAQVPPNIAKELITVGRGVCVPETAYLYRPLQPNPPYPGVTIVRDISFGPDPKDVLDVFAPEKGGGKRPVLLYVSGGAGNKLQGGPNGDVFYDNVMLWAVKSGMVGVNMQRHPGPEWNDPAKAVGMIVQWVNQNIASHKGNPARVFIWSQTAGNVPVGLRGEFEAGRPLDHRNPKEGLDQPGRGELCNVPSPRLGKHQADILQRLVDCVEVDAGLRAEPGLLEPG